MMKPAFANDPGINFKAPVLYDAETGTPIRNAVEEEVARSRAAKQAKPGADRRVEGPGVE